MKLFMNTILLELTPDLILTLEDKTALPWESLGMGADFILREDKMIKFTNIILMELTLDLISQ